MSTPTGTRGLTNAERAQRNRAIAEAHLGGATWEQFAERFGVSKATARRAATEHGESVARLGKSDLVPVDSPATCSVSGCDQEAVAFSRFPTVVGYCLTHGNVVASFLSLLDGRGPVGFDAERARWERAPRPRTR